MPGIYPHKLEARFPRITETIASVWDSPEEAAAVFEDLLIDRRGDRQGFPPEIASEILRLSLAYETLKSARDERREPWGEERKRAIATLEELGMRPIASDMLRAAESGDLERLRLFLKSGLPADARDAREWTPLMVAAFHGREAAAKLLIENGANPRARDARGYTPLHWAALKGYGHVVALLVRKADCDVQSKAGITPLLQAAAQGYVEVVQLLLSAGADPNIATHDGWTALHKAVANGHTEVVAELLAAGADVARRHADGTTPLRLALEKNHRHIVHMLRRARRNATAVPASRATR